MARRTPRQRAWHALRRRLGRDPETDEIDREVERQQGILFAGTEEGTESGTVPGNKISVPGNKASVPGNTPRTPRPRALDSLPSEEAPKKKDRPKGYIPDYQGGYFFGDGP